MEKIVNFLKSKNLTISSMESCTGGLFASEITNMDGASNVFKLGLVTYATEFKEYFGVSKDIIEKYTVYSNETSEEMAKNVCKISNSDYSVGITGQIGAKDKKNESNDDDIVYITIYDKKNNISNNYKIEAKEEDKHKNKVLVIDFIKEKLYEICK